LLPLKSATVYLSKPAGVSRRLNPFAPGNFAKKCLLKRVNPFLGHSLAKKNRNCPKRCYKSSTRLAFIPGAKLQLKSKFSIHSKNNSLLPASSAFLSSFFSFVGHLLGFLLVGKGFAKSPWMKEVQVGSGTRFSLEFSGQSYRVFAFFSGLFD